MNNKTNKKFFNEQMQLSPYNYDPRVTSQLNLADKVTLCDATLREGAQGTVIWFTHREKMEILKKSADAGVKLFQIGTLMDMDAMNAIMKEIRSLNLNIETEMLGGAQGDDWKSELDRNLDVGTTYIDILNLLTPYSAALNQGKSMDMVIGNMGDQISYLVSKGARVSYDPMDAPRTDFDTLMKAYKTAVDAGAERIRVLDSVGTASPATWRFLVSTIRNEFKDVKLCAHCHNDYGQAMANVYTSIECGADMVDVCINGLGERAGNASLAEVAAGSSILYDCDTGIQLDKMYELSKMVSDIARQPLERNRPIVGEWAFSHGDEGHYRTNHFAPWAFEGIKADVFGNYQKILLGNMAGTFATMEKLATLGYQNVTEEIANAINIEVKYETTMRKKVLDDDFILRIAKKYIKR